MFAKINVNLRGQLISASTIVRDLLSLAKIVPSKICHGILYIHVYRITGKFSGSLNLAVVLIWRFDR